MPTDPPMFPLVDERLGWLSSPVRDVVLTFLAIARGPFPVVSSVAAARANLSHHRFGAATRVLIRAGLIVGNRGPSGGYRLMRAPHQVTLLELVIAGAPVTRDADGNVAAFVALADGLEAFLREHSLAEFLPAGTPPPSQG